MCVLLCVLLCDRDDRSGDRITKGGAKNVPNFA